MNREHSDAKAGDVLVCGDCGRVNAIPQGLTRSSAVRCSGCGVLLCGQRPRKTSVICPNCQARLEIDAAWLGQTVGCGNCSTEFVAERLPASAIPIPDKSHGESPPGEKETGVGVAEMPEGELENHAKGRQKVRRSRKRKRTRERSSKHTLWLVGATVVTFGVVVGMIIEVGRHSEWWLVKPVDVPITSQPLPTAKQQPPDLAPEESKAMGEVLRRFFEAVSPEDALAVCRFQGEVGVRMRSLPILASKPPMQPVGLSITARYAIGTRLFLRLTGQVAGEAGKSVSVVLERPTPGNFLVDWDSHVRFASEAWVSFVTRRSDTTGRFQFRLKRQFAGNVAYPIEKWTSFLVFWDDETDGVNLFVPTDSPECEALLTATEPEAKVPAIEEVRGEGGQFPVTLEVFFPPESNQQGMPPALEMKKFCHSGWVDLREG